MLPFDYCCSSAKKELKRRTCKVCNQYIPSAYRMKNHYKIHQEHYEDFDHDDDDQPTPTKLSSKLTTADGCTKMNTEKATPVLKTEMLDWLRSDFDQVDSEASASDRVTRSMQKLNVAEKSLEEDQDQDWVHLE
jgi:hypothetical protein